MAPILNEGYQSIKNSLYVVSYFTSEDWESDSTEDKLIDVNNDNLLQFAEGDAWNDSGVTKDYWNYQSAYEYFETAGSINVKLNFGIPVDDSDAVDAVEGVYSVVFDTQRSSQSQLCFMLDPVVDAYYFQDIKIVSFTIRLNYITSRDHKTLILGDSSDSIIIDNSNHSIALTSDSITIGNLQLSHELTTNPDTHENTVQVTNIDYIHKLNTKSTQYLTVSPGLYSEILQAKRKVFVGEGTTHGIYYRTSDNTLGISDGATISGGLEIKSGVTIFGGSDGESGFKLKNTLAHRTISLVDSNYNYLNPRTNIIIPEKDGYLMVGYGNYKIWTGLLGDQAFHIPHENGTFGDDGDKYHCFYLGDATPPSDVESTAQTHLPDGTRIISITATPVFHALTLAGYASYGCGSYYQSPDYKIGYVVVDDNDEKVSGISVIVIYV